MFSATVGTGAAGSTDSVIGRAVTAFVLSTALAATPSNAAAEDTSTVRSPLAATRVLDRGVLGAGRSASRLTETSRVAAAAGVWAGAADSAELPTMADPESAPTATNRPREATSLRPPDLRRRAGTNASAEHAGRASSVAVAGSNPICSTAARRAVPQVLVAASVRRACPVWASLARRGCASPTAVSSFASKPSGSALLALTCVPQLVDGPLTATRSSGVF